MRCIILALMLMQVFDCIAQNKSSLTGRFCVLSAERTKNSSGKALKSLECIDAAETLTIEKGGSLLLVGELGIPISFEKDTILEMRSLVIQHASNKKRKTIYYHGEISPAIEHLFIMEFAMGQRSRLLYTRACHDCKDTYTLLYPPVFSYNELYYSGDLCLKWDPDTVKQFQVEVISGTTREIHKTTKNELRIRREPTDQDEITVVITDASGRQKSAPFSFRPFPEQKIKFPFECEPITPGAALMEALYLELLPIDHSAEAEEFFILATKLSNNGFYQTMLENFRKRHPTNR